MTSHLRSSAKNDVVSWYVCLSWSWQEMVTTRVVQTNWTSQRRLRIGGIDKGSLQLLYTRESTYFRFPSYDRQASLNLHNCTVSLRFVFANIPPQQTQNIPILLTQAKPPISSPSWDPRPAKSELRDEISSTSAVYDARQTGHHQPQFSTANCPKARKHIIKTTYRNALNLPTCHEAFHLGYFPTHHRLITCHLHLTDEFSTANSDKFNARMFSRCSRFLAQPSKLCCFGF